MNKTFKMYDLIVFVIYIGSDKIVNFYCLLIVYIKLCNFNNMIKIIGSIQKRSFIKHKPFCKKNEKCSYNQKLVISILTFPKSN